jgi:hypothetical protein
MRALVIPTARSIEPGRQEALTTAEIQNPLGAGQQPLPENCVKRRIPAHFAASFEVPKKVRIPVLRASRFDQGVDGGVRPHVSTECKVTGVSLAAAIACSTLGNTSNMTGDPDGVCAAFPS